MHTEVTLHALAGSTHTPATGHTGVACEVSRNWISDLAIAYKGPNFT
jgi:hypothetical protein